MFERFTDRNRRVVLLAQEEARLLCHNYIGTEHLLLGLVHEGESVAAQALDALGITLEEAREQVEDLIGPGQTTPAGHFPFTPRAKEVLELSLRRALRLGQNHIGPEHLLLALVKEGEGIGAQVLRRLGAPLDRLEQQVLALLGPTDVGRQGPPTTPRQPPPRPARATGHSESPRPPLPGGDVDRLGDGALQAVMTARQTAGDLGETELGAEHLLFGLLQAAAADDPAAALLGTVGLTSALLGVLAALAEPEGVGQQQTEGAIVLPRLGPSAQAALDQAAAAAPAGCTVATLGLLDVLVSSRRAALAVLAAGGDLAALREGLAAGPDAQSAQG